MTSLLNYSSIVNSGYHATLFVRFTEDFEFLNVFLLSTQPDPIKYLILLLIIPLPTICMVASSGLNNFHFHLTLSTI